jgi:CheY-like chemotaxis protein
MAGSTILVIEDNSIQREGLVIVLRQHGFTVLTVAGANEALSKLSSGPMPDLILLDMLVPAPGGDGWWFLQQRQRIPALAAAPVIVTTALAVASLEWADSLGAAGLIRKPFDVDPLMAEIRRCLNDKGQG